MAVDNEKNPVLGIDLGTTFSAVARWDGKGPRVYTNPQGDNTTQSVVYYDERTNTYIVGAEAYNKSLVSPDYAIVGVKRLMDDRSHVIKLGSKAHNPVEISGIILSTLYKNICNQFPKGFFESRGVVVSVPYYFKAHQCANTREAADAAQLNFMGIIQEPIAASLAYALEMVRTNPNMEREETVLVFDLGGGTFDLTIFQLQQTRDKLLFEVLGSGGDDRLGGLDFDAQLKEYLIQSNSVNLDSLDDKLRKIAVQKLMVGAKTVKEALTFNPTYNLVIPFLTADYHVDVDLTRPEFEKCIEPYVTKVGNILEDAFAQSHVKKKDVTRVIKVGGSSKIPIFTQMLQDEIGKDKIYGNIDPSLCVAEGAAIYAAYLDDRDVLGREVEIITRASHALGIETGDGSFFPLMPTNAKLPYERRQIFTTDRDNMTEFDVNVYQGGSRVAKQNALVGKVQVKGLLPKPKEHLNIAVTFRVNEEQRVSIVIEEPESGIRVMEALRYS